MPPQRPSSIDLNVSIDYGLESCKDISGDYFLFDGSDFTSLIGSYEVFEQSDAKFLFKNQTKDNLIYVFLCLKRLYAFD